VTLVFDWIAMGHERLEEEDYGEAIVLFGLALVKDPGNARVYYLLGLAQLGAGRNVDAKRTFLRAMELGYYVPKLALEVCEQG
jgi:Flp pilus assembly protein TadD